MAQFNITLTTELLHGLFSNNGRDQAVTKLDMPPESCASFKVSNQLVY